MHIPTTNLLVPNCVFRGVTSEFKTGELLTTQPRLILLFPDYLRIPTFWTGSC